MHQSRMFSIQLRYVFSKRSGTKTSSLFFATSMAGSASGFIFTNHWVETSGSTLSWQR